MSSAEGIVNVFVSQGSKFLAKLFVVLLFALVKTQVLQQNNLTRLHSSNLCLSVLTYRIGCKNNRSINHGCQILCHRCQRERFFIAFTLGTTKVTHKDDLGASLKQIVNGGKSSANTRVVGYHAILQRHVEVNANDDALASRLHRFNSLNFCHEKPPKCRMRRPEGRRTI